VLDRTAPRQLWDPVALCGMRVYVGGVRVRVCCHVVGVMCVKGWGAVSKNVVVGESKSSRVLL
jgi:hypothetical protein